jgi:hypothetical protein
VAGAANCKRKYEPNFPTVQIVAAQPSMTVTAPELEALNLVAAPDRAAAPTLRVSRRRRGRKWPSYQQCVEHAPKAHGSDRTSVARISRGA